MPAFSRVVVIVLDSVGIGALPDAIAYGDQGSNTLGHIAERVPLHIPLLRSLGLDRSFRWAKTLSGSRQARTAGWPRRRPARIPSLDTGK